MQNPQQTNQVLKAKMKHELLNVMREGGESEDFIKTLLENMDKQTPVTCLRLLVLK